VLRHAPPDERAIRKPDPLRVPGVSRPRGRLGGALKKVGLSVASTLLAFTATEVGGRAWFWHRYGHSFEAHHVFHPHPDFVFALNPRDEAWSALPRDHDSFFHIPPLRASDGPRLWALGGSTTAANPDGSDWPQALQQLLAPTGVRVVNMGHGGWGTDQLHRLYRAERARVRPFVVLLHDGWNYRGATATRNAFVPLNAASPLDAWPVRLSAWLTDHSAFYAALRMTTRTHPPCGTAFVYPEKSEWEQDLRALLSDMSGEDIHVILYPSLAMREDVRPFLHLSRPEHRCVAEHFELYRAEYEARIAILERVTRELGVDRIDTRPDFSDLPPRLFGALFQDFGHLEPQGNRLLALSIERALRERGVLPPGYSPPGEALFAIRRSGDAGTVARATFDGAP
jgi:hypothetical protein